MKVLKKPALAVCTAALLFAVSSVAHAVPVDEFGGVQAANVDQYGIPLGGDGPVQTQFPRHLSIPLTTQGLTPREPITLLASLLIQAGFLLC